MTDGQILVGIMLENGVPIDSVERKIVASSIDRAIERQNIVFVYRRNRMIGFLTYTPYVSHIYIDYCFVYPKYRDKASFLSLRKMFRSMGANFRWRTRRRERYCEVK